MKTHRHEHTSLPIHLRLFTFISVAFLLWVVQLPFFFFLRVFATRCISQNVTGQGHSLHSVLSLSFHLGNSKPNPLITHCPCPGALAPSILPAARVTWPPLGPSWSAVSGTLWSSAQLTMAADDRMHLHSMQAPVLGHVISLWALGGWRGWTRASESPLSILLDISPALGLADHMPMQG